MRCPTSVLLSFVFRSTVPERKLNSGFTAPIPGSLHIHTPVYGHQAEGSRNTIQMRSPVYVNRFQS